MDRIQRGIATRIEHWIEAVEGGNVLSNSDIRWLVGKEGLADYQAEVSTARAKRDEMKVSYPDTPHGEVGTYLKALKAAREATVAMNRAGNKEPQSTTPAQKRTWKAWKERRVKASTLQEACMEDWETVDPKHHRLFRLPGDAQAETPGHGHDADAVYASFEFPPAIPLTMLEIEPTPDLLNVPRHQQRDLLLSELARLEGPRPAQPMTMPAHAQRLRKAAEQ